MGRDEEAAEHRVQFVLDFVERLVEHDRMSVNEEFAMLERLHAAIDDRIRSVQEEIESEELSERAHGD